jgi:hypothetical protein
MNRNKNLKIIGFFGQSGAGKTTIIRNVRGPINGHRISPSTGIIRYLFNKNTYVNPVGLLQTYRDVIEGATPDELNTKIDEIYEKYIKSQMQLLNDFSTEVFLSTQDTHTTPVMLLTDRSPIDFYAITVGGMKYLQSQLNKEPNDHCKFLIGLCKETAEVNTKNFYNAIFVTHPWKTQGINRLKDGIRDQYLTEFYTGDNWYKIMEDVDIGDVKLYNIEGDIVDLLKRAKVVEECLQGV